MEASIVALLNMVLQGDNSTGNAIILLLLALQLYVYKYIMKPMYDKIRNIPDNDIREEKSEKFKELNLSHFKELETKLEKLEKVLDEMLDNQKGSKRDIDDIRTDISNVKSILNQFQGHMMYSGQGRRSSDFGNQELR